MRPSVQILCFLTRVYMTFSIVLLRVYCILLICFVAEWNMLWFTYQVYGPASLSPSFMPTRRFFPIIHRILIICLAYLVSWISRFFVRLFKRMKCESSYLADDLKIYSQMTVIVLALFVWGVACLLSQSPKIGRKTPS